jgi:hypothetical protein
MFAVLFRDKSADKDELRSMAAKSGELLLPKPLAGQYTTSLCDSTNRQGFTYSRGSTHSHAICTSMDMKKHLFCSARVNVRSESLLRQERDAIKLRAV